MKPAVGFTGGTASDSVFRPLPDDSGEYEVEDILDMRVRCRGRLSSTEYLVKWRGYGLAESTWEPVSNLTNCPEVLSAFEERRGLRSSHRGG